MELNVQLCVSEWKVGAMFGTSLNTNDNVIINISNLNGYLESILTCIGTYDPTLYNKMEVLLCSL